MRAACSAVPSSMTRRRWSAASSVSASSCRRRARRTRIAKRAISTGARRGRKRSSEATHMGYVASPRSDDRLGDLTARQEERLKELAKWPADAHRAWRRLDALERNLVIWQMAAKYGEKFAKEFLTTAGTRKTDDDLLQHYFGRSVGPAPGTLPARGFRLAQKDSIHEWWVHPGGRSIVRNYLDDVPTPPAPPPKPRPEACQQIDTLRDSICKNKDSICELADQLKDAKSRDTCQRARTS